MQTINMLGRRSIALVSLCTEVLVAKLEKIIADDLLLSVALLFLPIIYMLAALSLITNVGLGMWVLPAGLLLWAIAVAVLHREERWQKIATQLLLFLATFALIALATSQFPDVHWDSREYHYLAVQALLDGVNPFYEPIKWTTYDYPTAHWLLSSSLILWTNSIEASCAFTAPAMLTAFICSQRFIATLNGINRTWRIFLAFLLAANPIAVWTLFEHFTDGVFISTLLSFFMLMLALLANGKNLKQKDKNAKRVNTRHYYIYITASLILLINIKFSGLLFGAILGITALAYGLAVNSNTKQARKKLLQLGGLGTVVPVIAILFFGFFPYVTGYTQMKNPFYAGNIYNKQGEKVESIFRVFDRKFYTRSNYEKWWISLFTKEQVSWKKPTSLPPFSFAKDFSIIFGFGSIFNGAMLLCLTLVFFIRSKSAWIIISGILASILMTKVGFFVRLAPQSWWIPIMILVFFLAKDGKDKNKSTPIPQNMPIPRVANIMAVVIAACLLYQPISYLGYNTIRHAYVIKKIYEFRKQGGWYVTIDEDVPVIGRAVFFKYYASGLTTVGLPAFKKCPEGSQELVITYGLVICRP